MSAHYRAIVYALIRIVQRKYSSRKNRNLAHSVQSITSANVPMTNFTRDDWQKYNNVMHCLVCEKPFVPDTRVRDHCYLTGRGPAYSNLNYRDLHCILTVFHNLSGYDAHFVIKNYHREGPVVSFTEDKRKIYLVY